jgi:carboxymethylenebutenolidase
MPMSKTTVLGDGRAYVAKPATHSPWPALLRVHEWWGLDPQTASIADRLAALGYLAAAPDLYDGDLAALGDSEGAAALLQKHGTAAPEKLVRMHDALRGDQDCNGTVGCMGFCFGGRMALALAVQRPLAAVVTFYGGGMQALFDRLHLLTSPVLGLFGDQDQSIPKGTIEQFDQLLERQGIVHEIHIYPDSGHAFFRDTDPESFRPEAARDAWQRAAGFLRRHMPLNPTARPQG